MLTSKPTDQMSPFFAEATVMRYEHRRTGRLIHSCARWRGSRSPSEIIGSALDSPFASLVGIRRSVKEFTGPVPAKMLVFSRFSAAPPALASLMSFAMETEVARGSRNYERLGKARPLAASATRLPLLALFLPSPTIIRNTDPLRSER